MPLSTILRDWQKSILQRSFGEEYDLVQEMTADVHGGEIGEPRPAPMFTALRSLERCSKAWTPELKESVVCQCKNLFSVSGPEHNWIP